MKRLGAPAAQALSAGGPGPEGLFQRNRHRPDFSLVQSRVTLRCSF